MSQDDDVTEWQRGEDIMGETPRAPLPPRTGVKPEEQERTGHRLRRAEDKDEIRARQVAWCEFEYLQGQFNEFDALMGALDVYRRELATAAVKKLGMAITLAKPVTNGNRQ